MSVSITDQEIKDIATRVSLGMSKNQILDYVIKSHVTADRQLKQVLLEIENRSHQYERMLLDEKKGGIRLRRDQETVKKLKADPNADPYELEFAEAEVEFAELDKEMWNRRKGQAQYELQVFLDYILERNLTKEDLLKAVEWNAEDERKYWIARLGKQAALEIIANGRVGTGNMDSIAMMSQEDQVGILDVASQYSCLMKISMDKIQGKTEKYFQAYAESPEINVPTFHGVEEHLNIPLLDKIRNDLDEKRLQSTDQSKD